MKQLFILVFFIHSFFSVVCQERRPIKGQLLYKNTKVVAANVVNNTAQTNTITDSDGAFEIDVLLGIQILLRLLRFYQLLYKFQCKVLWKVRDVVDSFC